MGKRQSMVAIVMMMMMTVVHDLFLHQTLVLLLQEHHEVMSVVASPSHGFRCRKEKTREEICSVSELIKRCCKGRDGGDASSVSVMVLQRLFL
jgi:hypothetical protein